LQPEVWRYEVMPWPGRIFTGKYPKERVGKTSSALQNAERPTG